MVVSYNFEPGQLQYQADLVAAYKYRNARERLVLAHLEDKWPHYSPCPGLAACRFVDKFKATYPDVWDAWLYSLPQAACADGLVSVVLSDGRL